MPHPVPTFHFSATTGRAFLPYLKKMLAKAAVHLPQPLSEVSIALVGDKRMADLHVQFMNVAGTTDVLTFPLDEGEGEIIVCVPYALREARRRGTQPRQELLLYALHGLLHLCGHDDLNPKAYAAMHAEEDRILSAIGVGAVFARGNPAAD